MLQIHDTLHRRPHTLAPGEDGRFRMYVCGVTVYDLVHIGHARSALVYDALVRFLRGLGMDVMYVRNFTDVDDRIIERANEAGEDPLAFSQRMIDAFYHDMDRVGLLRPDVEPKVSEHIPQIIELVEKLVDRGHAYEVEGDVFFAVDSWPDYGELSGRKVDEQREGFRVDVDSRKRHHADFALWKATKPGEPWWESPWGRGRPGWHIECSAMSMAYLGESFELHGGGDDLIFPHHENEIAQSRAGTGGDFARCWMHNGMITTDGEKMSKSLGNFWTLRDVLEVHDPEVVRMFALSKHYRSPVDYNEKSLHDALEGLRRLYRAKDDFARGVEAGDPEAAAASAGALAAAQRAEALPAAVAEALGDDFNTGRALGILFEFAREQCRSLEALEGDPGLASCAAASSEAFAKCASWMGFLDRDLEAFDASVESLKRAAVGVDPAEIEALIERRNEARQAKDWAAADRIRDELLERGVAIKDGPEGTTWSMQ
jgi:cysteinyl-tRNA synthetase